MIPKAFSKSAPGRVVRTLREYYAFVPNPLPPKLDIAALVPLLEEASHAVGDLKGVGYRLPNPRILLRPFLRREAVLSSRIEGTQASISDLLYYEAAPENARQQSDVQEVVNYIKAAEHGLARLAELPLSLRLCRDVHEVLMRGVRGEHATPGEFRKMQNWIGPPGCTLNEAAYVPPPLEEMNECLSAWERYLHDRESSALIQAALIHYQFEAIHPFIDGNGRVGRLMISLFLAERRLLPDPLLYLSAFFEKHRADYYRLLMRVSTHGEWREWLEFFLRGVREQAREASGRVQRIVALQAEYRDLMLQQGKAAASLVRLVDCLFENPAITAKGAQKALGQTFRAAQQNIERLIALRIVKEISGNERNRIYVAQRIVDVAMEDIA